MRGGVRSHVAPRATVIRLSDISYNAYTVAAEFLDDVYKDESFFVKENM